MTTSTLRGPELAEEDFERFLVHDRFEIISILRRLEAKREQVTLSVDGETHALTVLLAVNPDYEEIVFDCGREAESNRRVMQAERVTLAANIDGIKVQFSSRGADPTVFEGHPALRMRLPDLVLRLQRRDYYRVPASLTCEAAVECEGKVRVLEMRVTDLSLGGVALITDKTYVKFAPGEILQNCRMGLGTLGVLAPDLEVKNVCEVRARNGARQVRIGCRFAGLERDMESMISRYIAQKERDRRLRT